LSPLKRALLINRLFVCGRLFFFVRGAAALFALPVVGLRARAGGALQFVLDSGHARATVLFAAHTFPGRVSKSFARDDNNNNNNNNILAAAAAVYVHTNDDGANYIICASRPYYDVYTIAGNANKQTNEIK